ncbi:phosphoenolpyruvate carboxykinase [Clostridium sp. NSJ-49]|uniref:phosphoenolpyruvate carboxykinase n=1 Tax=Clostridium TaxID=1485 RepID=UPI00164B3529|nr:phosphoenolpyruvate carboxykinase [Clostridium sp. NSJ-49]MBC5625958.1 phosphoenolpyruvate carboxykinase [Clostridium sp. NSJ-49]MDU6340476.1 phosphoenolpyruvate carboxykinase [Clostridium sp.]
MRKEFSINNDKVLINFTAKYCTTYEMVLDSDGFRRTLEVYLKKAQNKRSNSYRYLTEALESNDIQYIRKNLVTVFKWLTLMTVEEILEVNINYKGLFEDRNEFIKVIEDFYRFWRRLERYTIIHTDRVRQGLAAMSFTEANSNFSRLILKLYRKVEENVLGEKPLVFRQIPVGGNCSVMINKVNWPMPKSYRMLQEINFIDCILIEPPFITYPKRNTRTGIFSEVTENPLKNCVINKEHWFCYPAKVGELLAYVYFHRDFMEHGITLCNLFEMAKRDECRNRKPDIIYVFGGTDKEEDFKTVFYDDVENDIMLGYINHSDQIDYFGYMKKMILTLHNLIMIKKGYLPIHGAMVNIKLKSGKEANVVIMGDSGAGKSESLEAFRALGKDNISDMTVIFDDMGIFKNTDNEVVGYGTEIGAFVRLDDLEQGYAFNEIDRSIFMNPDKINARLVMPITPYFEIVKGYKVDMMLYANNYTAVEAEDKSIEFFGNVDEAINVFKSGARMAKGTTSEKGLVESYFANPFGPVQMKEKTDVLIEEYFNLMFKNNIKVGQIKTCLGIKGQEKDGPRRAAIELFDIIKTL